MCARAKSFVLELERVPQYSTFSECSQPRFLSCPCVQIGLPLATGGDRRPWFFNDTATPAAFLAAKPVAWGQALQGRDAGVQLGGFVTTYVRPGVTAKRSWGETESYSDGRAAVASLA